MLSAGIVPIGIVIVVVVISGNGHYRAAMAFAPLSSARRPSRPRRPTGVFFRDTGDRAFDGATGEEVAEPPSKGGGGGGIAGDKKPSDFQSRMKRIVVQQRRRPTTQQSRRKNNIYRPENVKIAESLEDFATVIDEGRRSDRVVVVRFYATWCKLCHSLRPAFDRAAASTPQAIFVDVPVLETNANLHQGLGVESVPYAHIYHPEKGLVVETRLSRKAFSEFEESVKMHCL
mmetsp:Transcript_7395/g.18348  ORF Transcript_7395/g.18348 Transcript_7395/m.18348 type:complete len:231 (-) Transcript_7395:111-803(-)